MRSILGHFGILLSSIDPDAQEIIDRITITPPIETITRYNVLVLGLKRAGYWDRFDSLYVSKQAADQQAALLDWRRPVSGSINGSASWSSSDGFVGSTVSGSYIDTNFTPSTDGVNVLANSAGYGCIINTAATASNSVIWGVQSLADTNNTRTRLYYSTTAGGNFGGLGSAALHGYDFSNSGIPSAAGSGGTGMLQMNRTAANAMELFKDAVSLGVGTYNNVNRARPALPVYICAENDLGTSASWSDAKISAWWAGGVFDSVEQAEIKSLFDTFFIP